LNEKNAIVSTRAIKGATVGAVRARRAAAGTAASALRSSAGVVLEVVTVLWKE
jgi:hypothetical protein